MSYFANGILAFLKHGPLADFPFKGLEARNDRRELLAYHLGPAAPVRRQVVLLDGTACR